MLSTIYTFILMSACYCVGMDPCALLCQEAYDAVKTALDRVFDWQHRC